MMTMTNFVDILPNNDDDNVELFDEDDVDEDIMNMEDNENNEIGEKRMCHCSVVNMMFLPYCLVN